MKACTLQPAFLHRTPFLALLALVLALDFTQVCHCCAHKSNGQSVLTTNFTLRNRADSFSEVTFLSLLVTFLSLLVTFLSLLVTFLSLLVTFLSLLVTFLSLLVTFLSLLVTFLSLLVTFLSLLVTFLSLLVTFLSLLVTFLSLLVTFLSLLVTFLSLLVTFLSLLVTFFSLLVTFFSLVFLPFRYITHTSTYFQFILRSEEVAQCDRNRSGNVLVTYRACFVSAVRVGSFSFYYFVTSLLGNRESLRLLKTRATKSQPYCFGAVKSRAATAALKLCMRRIRTDGSRTASWVVHVWYGLCSTSQCDRNRLGNVLVTYRACFVSAVSAVRVGSFSFYYFDA